MRPFVNPTANTLVNAWSIWLALPGHLKAASGSVCALLPTQKEIVQGTAACRSANLHFVVSNLLHYFL